MNAVDGNFIANVQRCFDEILETSIVVREEVVSGHVFDANCDGVGDSVIVKVEKFNGDR